MEHLSALVLKNAGHKVLYTIQSQLLSLNLILFNSKKGKRKKDRQEKKTKKKSSGKEQPQLLKNVPPRQRRPSFLLSFVNICL